MKHFIKRLIVFLIPLLILFGGIEMYFRHYRNAFAIKAEYFSKNKSNIEVLVLGSSHNQNGVNPEFFSQHTANLAYASQDIKIDSAMFFNNVREMKNLKTVVFELDYHRLDIENKDDYFRYPWYYIYYGLEIVPIKMANRLSLYMSDPVFFNNNLMSILKGEYQSQEINEFGYVEKNYLSQFGDMNYDSLAIHKSANERLKNKDLGISDVFLKRNTKRIISMIEYCRAHGIKIYFFSTPLYQTYRDKMLESKKERFSNFVNKLRQDFNVPYYDLHDDNRFGLKDFSNDDHLNPDGAKKYSEIIDGIITAKN